MTSATEKEAEKTTDQVGIDRVDGEIVRDSRGAWLCFERENVENLLGMVKICAYFAHERVDRSGQIDF